MAVLFFLSGPQAVSARPTDYAVARPVFAFEFLSFKVGNGEKSLLEIFCQIPADVYQFVKFKDEFYASYELTISPYDQYARQVEMASLIDSVMVRTFYEIDLRGALHLIRCAFVVDPDEYHVRIRLRDLETLES